MKGWPLEALALDHDPQVIPTRFGEHGLLQGHDQTSACGWSPVGLGFHIGPQGSIEPCPPLSFACQTIGQNDGDLFQTINQSQFLRDFQQFVRKRTRGCVILELSLIHISEPTRLQV